MLIMVSYASQDATVVGRRLRRRVLLALCLSGLLPVLVLAYAVLRYLFADVGSLRGVHLIGLQGLVFFTLLAMVGGAWIIWDIGRAVSRMGELLSPQPNATAPGARTDEVGALMKSRSEEHTSELQSPCNLVCRLLLEKKKKDISYTYNAPSQIDS